MGPLLVVAAIIPEEDKYGKIRYLMTKRAEGKMFSGQWEFPGGTVREGESPEQALERELMGELGIEIVVDEGFLRIDYTTPDGFEINLAAYRCRHVSGEISMNEKEVSDYDYIFPKLMDIYPILRVDQFIVEQLLREAA